VEFVLEDEAAELAAEEEDDEEFDDESQDPGLGRDLDQMQADIITRMSAPVRQWCFAARQTPHPRLDEAVSLVIGSLGAMASSDPRPLDPESEEAGELASQAFEALLATEPPETRPALLDAIAQVQAFMGRFPSPDDMFASVFPDLAAEEAEEKDNEDDPPKNRKKKRR
jgi:hypothetical protein